MERFHTVCQCSRLAVSVGYHPVSFPLWPYRYSDALLRYCRQADPAIVSEKHAHTFPDTAGIVVHALVAIVAARLPGKEDGFVRASVSMGLTCIIVLLLYGLFIVFK